MAVYALSKECKGLNVLKKRTRLLLSIEDRYVYVNSETEKQRKGEAILICFAIEKHRFQLEIKRNLHAC